MRKGRFLLVAAILLLLPSAVMAGAVTAKHSVELKDSAGDVKSHGGDPGKDVVGLKIASDGANLEVTVSLGKDIGYYLEGHKAGDVIQLYLDTDNNEATGGQPFWGSKKGFEYLVGLRTCIAYRGGGEACAGGIKGFTPERYFSSYVVEKIAEGTKTTKKTHDIFWESPRADIKSNIVRTTIPYEEIGVSSGRTIRIAVREYDSTYDDRSFFPDVILTLK